MKEWTNRRATGEGDALRPAAFQGRERFSEVGPLGANAFGYTCGEPAADGGDREEWWDTDDALRSLRSLRAIAHRNGPTPATLAGWMLHLSETIAAAPPQHRGRPPALVTRALRNDLAHILRTGISRGAFRVGDEAAAVRFALDVAYLMADPPRCPVSHASPERCAGHAAIPATTFEERLYFLLRAWGHLGSLTRGEVGATPAGTFPGADGGHRVVVDGEGGMLD